MPLLTAIARRALRGPASRGLARAIPNPMVRYVAMITATALLPRVLSALSRRRTPR